MLLDGKVAMISGAALLGPWPLLTSAKTLHSVWSNDDVADLDIRRLLDRKCDGAGDSLRRDRDVVHGFYGSLRCDVCNRFCEIGADKTWRNAGIGAHIAVVTHFCCAETKS